MLAYGFLVAAVATCSLTAYAEQRFIKEISEGPYQKYSGQPLVDLGGKFYYFEISVPSDWNQATTFCRNLGLFLTAIEDDAENALIKDYIVNYIGPKNYWTSGNDLSIEGSYVWASTGRPMLYTDWHTGQPDNNSGDEHCVGYWHDSGVLNWNDFGCYEGEMYALCEEM